MAKTTDIRVLFVRTGETEWERAGRIAGSTDVPLTAAGWERLNEAFKELDGARLSSVLCAPDEASQAVARELAKVCGAKVKVVEDLAEFHLGLWEGMLKSELQEKCPRAFRQWIDDPAAVQVPEGEGVEDAQNRLMDALSRNLGRVRGGEGGAVGVVLRPMALGLVGCALTGVPTRNIWSMMECGPILEWRTVDRGNLRAATVRTGVGA
jgi:broad specificity phosphatase PhoE